MHPSIFDIRYFVFVIAFLVLMSLYYLDYVGLELPVIGKIDLIVPLFLNSLYFAILGLAGILVGFQTSRL